MKYLFCAKYFFTHDDPHVWEAAPDCSQYATLRICYRSDWSIGSNQPRFTTFSTATILDYKVYIILGLVILVQGKYNVVKRAHNKMDCGKDKHKPILIDLSNIHGRPG